MHVNTIYEDTAVLHRTLTHQCSRQWGWHPIGSMNTHSFVCTVDALVDQTRVLLQGKDGDYINANHVMVSHLMTVIVCISWSHLWFLTCVFYSLHAILLPKVKETGQRYILTQVSTVQAHKQWIYTQIEQLFHCTLPLLCSYYV